MKNAKAIIDKNRERAQKQNEKRVERLKAKIKKEIIPSLSKMGMGAYEAMTFLQVNDATFNQAAFNKAMEMPSKELGLRKMLAAGKTKEQYTTLFDLLDEESVKDCREIFTAMQQDIENNLKDMNKDVMFSELDFVNNVK